ncbi:hypothetical protein TSTA_066560 [Talaromyces stipitatus ATCC 10500]|uniref:Retroviral polymerase SH3-like domain-containing protein n=1 Tax=Talaromyces stipitatus (strain ATCC 10500 / CBS 375.48 / QM 6759 / NRRL 1006) TaxID=441959 RepID=B8LXC8_TALSN|nr:uncharacterized protein TSTA_066560 [Talaromyces stipitatus ATCC 10500]EED23209.1 hypothetical protein TSTA_066560 [Talaromyces stipitatus ATCC 10500]
MVYGKKPYIGNLYLLGSKAYIRIDTKKSEKMEPRAQIGYLVGYESHNIWLIWTEGPRGTKVIRARDVIFNKMKNDQNQDDNMEINDVHGQQDNQLVQFNNIKNKVTLYGDEPKFDESRRVTGEDSGEEEAQQDEGAERENMALTAGTTTSPSGIPSKRARSPEIATSKAERKRHQAFFARIKLLQESSAYKAFLAAAEKLDGYKLLHKDIPPEPRNWIGRLQSSKHKFVSKETYKRVWIWKHEQQRLPQEFLE